MDEDRTLHSLDFGFLSSFFNEKLFFPKFELLNSGCGLSASLYGTLYLGKCCLLTGHPMSCFTSPGLSDTVYSTFVAPCQWYAKMVTYYSVEKNCVKMGFDELEYFKKLHTYKICRFNKNKKFAIGQLNP